MFDVRHHERIDSTNDEAVRLANEGAPHGTVVQADEQSAGRGRLERRWFSPRGNLYISILLRCDVPPARNAELSFVSGLAVADTVVSLLPKQADVRLKWPNDVLVDGAKISGVLIEEAGGALIVGIGLNVLLAPDNAAYRTTTIAASGGMASIDQARSSLLDRLAVYLATWETEGFSPIRAAWLARAHPVGQTLRITGGLEGRFAGLDDDGALLLDTADGRRRVLAGDVGLGAPT